MKTPGVAPLAAHDLSHRTRSQYGPNPAIQGIHSDRQWGCGQRRTTACGRLRAWLRGQDLHLRPPVAHSRLHADVPPGDPQIEGRVRAANFENARSVQKYAKSVLAVPRAAKFIPEVRKAVLQQRNEVHVVKANQLAKAL